MSTATIGEYPVRLYRQHQNDLILCLCESESLMGRRSNQSQIVSMLEGSRGAGREPCSDLTADHVTALEELAGRSDFQAAGLTRVVMRRLARIGEWERVILMNVYGPVRHPGLDAWGMLGPLVLSTEAAKEAHRRCHSTQQLSTWLVRLSSKILGEIDPRGNGRTRKPAHASDQDIAASKAIRVEAAKITLAALVKYDRVGAGR